MEWIELKLQEIVELSQRNKPSHVVLADDSWRVRLVPSTKTIEQRVLLSNWSISKWAYYKCLNYVTDLQAEGDKNFVTSMFESNI
jgi:hypothetical protein